MHSALPHTPLPIAFWAERRPDGSVAVESRPASLAHAARTPSDLPVLANDARAALASGAVPATLAPYLLDIRELFSLTHPVSSADEVPAILGELRGDGVAAIGAEVLAEAWPAAVARFRDWSAPLAETVVGILSQAAPAWRAVAEAIAGAVPMTLEHADSEFDANTMLRRLRPPYERPLRREVPDASLAEPIDPEEAANLLGPGGPCAATVPGYENRPGQLMMARAVADAFNRSKHLVVEAGTGVGKSLAYLLPSILWSRRNHLPVVVSTNTKNLQTQLFYKDIPTLRRVFETPFNAALIKGRMNYLCLRRLRHMLERRESEVSDDEAVAFAKTLVWAAVTTTGDLDELDRVAAAGGASLRSRLSCSSEECGGRRCPFFSRCLLQRARALALSADIIVANHSLVFAENGDGQSNVFPKYHQIVIDEAHNLEASATRHFTVEITPTRLAITLRRIWRTSKNGGTGALADIRLALQAAGPALEAAVADKLFEDASEAIFAADKVRATSDAFFRALGLIPRQGGGPVRFRAPDLAAPAWAPARNALAEFSDAIGALAVKLDGIRAAAAAVLEPPAAPLPNLQAWEEASRGVAAAVTSVAELQGDLSLATAGSDPETVYWIEGVSGPRTPPAPSGNPSPGKGLDRWRDRGEPMAAVFAAPVDISQKLADELFGVRQSVVLCSATLSVNGSFSFLAHRIGLDKIEEGGLLTCQAPSPFDYAGQCHACVPLFLPEPNDPAYTPALAAFLVRLFRRTRGRALVLFTSYEMMRGCAERLAAPLAAAGIALLVQGSGASRDRLTRTFRRDVSSVLLGTDSFWEGVDVVGESLTCVVLARLPFDAVGDPLVGARAERVQETSGDSFRGYSLPNAIIKFRQGFGRLIRHRADRGVVIVADRRLFSKGYGTHFRRNLPCPVSGHPTEDILYEAIAPYLT